MIVLLVRNIRFNSNLVVNFDVFDFVVYFDDGFSVFVIKDDGVFKNKIFDVFMLLVVDIVVIDVSLFNVNFNIVFIMEIWDWMFFERYVLDGLQNECLVLDW